MAKRYCVDTNILLYDNKFFDNDIFKDGELLITMTSISEIDHIKEHSKNQELKFKARNASRDLEDAVEEGKVKIIKTDGSCADESFSCYEVMDDLIISTIKANSLENEIIAVSRDYNFRLKCNGVGIPTSNYADDKSFDNLSDLYTGVIETEVSDDLVNLFYKQGFIFYKDLKLDRKPYPNEFIIARSNINSKRKIIARYIHSNKRFEKLRFSDNEFYGFKAKDIYQKFALELLLDPEVKIVTMTARQGTGKSFLAVGSLLELVVERGGYEKLLIGKNTTPLDKWSYQGFTTGNTDEKLLTHFNNYLTTLENLHENKSRDNTGLKLFESLKSLNHLDILDISSILGSSFNNKAICVDEAQSFDVSAMRSVLTRISDSCKLCIIGDIRQQSMTQLFGSNNGLYASIEWLKELDGVGHMTLKKGYRGSICDKVSEAFDKNIYEK